MVERHVANVNVVGSNPITRCSTGLATGAQGMLSASLTDGKPVGLESLAWPGVTSFTAIVGSWYKHSRRLISRPGGPLAFGAVIRFERQFGQHLQDTAHERTSHSSPARMDAQQK